MKRSNFQTVDEYIKTFPSDVQSTLETLRNTIKKMIPQAQEAISYQIPTFKLNGKFVIYFAAFKNHISLYPIPVMPEPLKKKILPFIKGKGTISFPLEKPLPLKLITEIIKYSLSDNLNKTKRK